MLTPEFQSLELPHHVRGSIVRWWSHFAHCSTDLVVDAQHGMAAAVELLGELVESVVARKAQEPDEFEVAGERMLSMNLASAVGWIYIPTVVALVVVLGVRPDRNIASIKLDCSLGQPVRVRLDLLRQVVETEFTTTRCAASRAGVTSKQQRAHPEGLGFEALAFVGKWLGSDTGEVAVHYLIDGIAFRHGRVASCSAIDSRNELFRTTVAVSFYPAHRWNFRGKYGYRKAQRRIATPLPRYRLD